jgi:hypothetical protein
MGVAGEVEVELAIGQVALGAGELCRLAQPALIGGSAKLGRSAPVVSSGPSIDEGSG